MNTNQSGGVGGLSFPRILTAGCRGCGAVIEYLGEITVRICDTCLDEACSDVVAVSPNRRRNNDGDVVVETSAISEDDGDEDDDANHDDEHLTYKPRASHVLDETAEIEVSIERACGFCINATDNFCPGVAPQSCGRRVCVDCVDECGRCPHCEDC